MLTFSFYEVLKYQCVNYNLFRRMLLGYIAISNLFIPRIRCFFKMVGHIFDKKGVYSKKNTYFTLKNAKSGVEKK